MLPIHEARAELVRYSAWASNKLLDFAITVPEQDVARAIPNSHGGVLKTFQHIYYADRVWLARLEHGPIQFEDPAPGPSLADLDRLWWPLLDRLAARAGEYEPDTELPIKWYTGAYHSLKVYRILEHVVNHGTYHRGQIAAMLRQSGHTPPSTDLLFYQLGL
jgi:uncharacterized damage-inducible protein DinB